MKERVIRQAEQLLPSLPGWCSPRKAGKLIRFVLSEQARCCVELGVFGGSSLIPQALALQALGAGGLVHGIDPYSTAEVLKSPPTRDVHSRFWQDLDLQQIKRDLLARLEQLSLRDFAILHQMTSDTAAQLFAPECIDLLHVDGNHSTEQALRDVQTWLPKLRSGGILFIDDISWGLDRLPAATTGPAIELALQQCTWLGVVDQCLICRKR